jgi:hypothetical protein
MRDSEDLGARRCRAKDDRERKPTQSEPSRSADVEWPSIGSFADQINSSIDFRDERLCCGIAALAVPPLGSRRLLERLASVDRQNRPLMDT